MCFEFVYACKSSLIDELVKVIGTDKYFLLCFGHLNYFYCDNLASIQRVYDLLKSKGVVLHDVEETDLSSIIDAQYMRENHTFHGSAILLNKFREKSEIS